MPNVKTHQALAAPLVLSSGERLFFPQPSSAGGRLSFARLFSFTSDLILAAVDLSSKAQERTWRFDAVVYGIWTLKWASIAVLQNIFSSGFVGIWLAMALLGS
jgi:hypothetical protein